jgi:putative nucleotidyltransferase with HDIG domain
MDIGPKHMDIIRRAAMLHDIGKIGVPDEILSKPSSLTPRERKIIEQHPLIAVRILDVMNFLESEIAIIRHHHEKWNGQGYPDGLAQNAIPLGARIMAVADTLDALTCPRSYRASRPLHEAIKILVDSASYEYDPEVVNGLICWIETLSHTLNKAPDQITAEDLLNSQKDDECEFGDAETLLEAVIG